jgi:hypothetical protein
MSKKLPRLKNKKKTNMDLKLPQAAVQFKNKYGIN